MATEKNRALRVIVPLIVILLGIGVVIAMFQGSGPASGTTNSGTNSSSSGPSSSGGAVSGTASTASPTAPAANSTPAAAASAPAPTTTNASNFLQGLRARAIPAPTTPLDTLGALDRSNTAVGASKLRITFSDTGAGIAALDLADHFETIERTENIRPQAERRVIGPDGTVNVLAPFAALAIEVGLPAQSAPAAALPAPALQSVIVPLATAPTTQGQAPATLWRPTGAPGAFEAFIDDANGAPVLRIDRQYTLADNGLAITLHQRVVNLTNQPFTIRWFQTGPVDMPQDRATYGGDHRRLRFGYLLPPEQDPTRAQVLSSEFWIPRNDFIGSRDSLGLLSAEVAKWPNRRSQQERLILTWTALTNRYFGASVYAIDPIPFGSPNAASAPTPGAPAPTLAWVAQVTRIVLDLGKGNEVPALRLDSTPLSLAAGASLDLSHGILAGPLSRRQIAAEPALNRVAMAGLVVYNFGGMCGWCTFPFLTSLLLWLLLHLHDWIFFDWALAIIFLVVIVRSCLHPVTRWSQIRMARFGKQMQALAPKQKALQEKFKDDPRKLQSETARLWGEEGVSPAGLLGCIPMFLQTPVWIALYATLFFAVELRHQPAFFGVFQSILPSGSMVWSFLGDLSEPDRLLYFGKTIVTLPLMHEIRSFNILPFVLALVFFIQQKYMTPPSSGLSPEQEMQQKIVKWMMVIMFPLLMYNAPSGLALYFIANSTLGILESKWIRAHMEKKGLLDVEKMKAEVLARRAKRKAAGSDSFIGRLQARVEAAQKAAQQAGKAGGKPGTPRPAKQVRNLRNPGK